VNDRISVSQASSWQWSTEQDLALYERAGVRRVGLTMAKLADVSAHDLHAFSRQLDDVGITVASLLALGPLTLDQPDRWPEQRDSLGRFMDVASIVRPEVGVLTTGPAGPLSWEWAADAFAQAIEGTVNEATREGLFLCLEPTNPLRTDVSFVHNVRDALELGFRCDMGVCLELHHAWAERNIVGLIAANPIAIGLVQLSDGRFGARTTPDRLVPGDGAFPLARVIRQLLGSGYSGAFELELVGPAIEDEGYESAILRGLRWLDALLTEFVEEDDGESRSDGVDDPNGDPEGGDRDDGGDGGDRNGGSGDRPRAPRGNPPLIGAQALELPQSDPSPGLDLPVVPATLLPVGADEDPA